MPAVHKGGGVEGKCWRKTGRGGEQQTERGEKMGGSREGTGIMCGYLPKYYLCWLFEIYLVRLAQLQTHLLCSVISE